MVCPEQAQGSCSFRLVDLVPFSLPTPGSLPSTGLSLSQKLQHTNSQDLGVQVTFSQIPET